MRSSSICDRGGPTSGILEPSEPSAASAPWSFWERKLAAALPGRTRFLPAAAAAAFDAVTSTRFRYAAPGARSRFPCLRGPWQGLSVQPRGARMRLWMVSNVLSRPHDPRVAENRRLIPNFGTLKVPVMVSQVVASMIAESLAGYG